jgi:glycosyltransferase involved in cell wall biosynthesis
VNGDAHIPAVSVVVAAYNMGDYVREAIDSVLAQQGVDLEVVVIDDGSTDDTATVLAEFNDDDRVRVIRQENQGQPRAKNAGLRACRGRLIAFCDADDYWLPDKLALQLPLFERDPRVGVVYSTILILPADGDPYAPPHDMYRGDVLDKLFVHNLVPFGTAVVRRECLEEAGGFDERIPMGIDWDLWLRIATRWHFDFVPEPTYAYRIWPGQMSHNWQGRYDCALKIMQRFLETHPGRIPASVVDTAYADTYTSLAGAHFEHTGVAASVRHVGSALRYRPTYWPAWRLLASMPWYLLRARLSG